MKQYQLTHVDSCPSCGDSSFSNVTKPIDFRATGDSFQVQRCKACGFVFTNPRPIGEDLAFFYNSENYISHNNSNQGFFNKVYKFVRTINLRNKYKLVSGFKSNGSLLDVGCGTGEFLNTCKSHGWKVTGIEPAPLARNYGIANFGLEIKSADQLFALSPNSFDVVTMWHVLEHVEELNNYLSTLKAILKDSGVLIIAVPNHESHDALYYGKDWAAWDVPIHLSHFNKKTMKAIVEKFGFSLKRIQNMNFDSFYVSILSEKNRSSKGSLFKGAWRGLVSNLKAGPNNASSLIYVFEKS